METSNPIEAVQAKYNIRPAEVIRQAYEYFNFSMTPSRIQERVDNYYRFKSIPFEVARYCNLILDGTIKLDSI